MLITAAYAQTVDGTGGGAFDLLQFLPFLAIFAVMYFLVLRPQQQRLKQHKDLVSNIRRGDTVVTAGGIIGKVTRVVDESEVQVEIADNVRVRVLKSTVSDVRAKGEPVKDAADA